MAVQSAFLFLLRTDMLRLDLAFERFQLVFLAGGLGFWYQAHALRGRGGQRSRTGFGNLCCTSKAICSSSTLTSQSRQQLSKQTAGGFFRCDCDFVGYPLYTIATQSRNIHSAMPVTLASTASQEHWSRNLSEPKRTWNPSSSGDIWPEAASSYPTSRQACSSWMPFETNW